MAGGGWRGHPGPSLKPFSELIKRLGPRRSMATGRRLQHPSRPRAAHARGRQIDRGRLGSLAAPAPPLLPPRCPATAARRAPIGRQRAGLPGGAWSVGQRGRGVARGLAAGAGRCRLPSDLSRRAEGAAGGKGAGEDGAARAASEKKFIDPFLISGPHGFPRWGRRRGPGGGGGVRRRRGPLPGSPRPPQPSRGPGFRAARPSPRAAWPPARAGKSQTGPGVRPESPGPKGWRWTCTREVRPGASESPWPAPTPQESQHVCPLIQCSGPPLSPPTAGSSVRRDSS